MRQRLDVLPIVNNNIFSCPTVSMGGLVPGLLWISKAADAQVSFIKWLKYSKLLALQIPIHGLAYVDSTNHGLNFQAPG